MASVRGVRTLFLLVIGTCCVVFAEDCLSTGRDCVKDCTHMRDGSYQSCKSCHYFVKCSNANIYQMPCPGTLEWDDTARQCVEKSNTCKGCVEGVSASMSLTFKPGTCPPPESPGMCIYACKTDDDCTGPWKCCFNGCGFNCMLPQDEPPVQRKPGRCPKPTGPDSCIELCHVDKDCPGKFKCCSNGCGHVCKPPVSESSEEPTEIETEVISEEAEAIRLNHIPKPRYCKSTGPRCVSDCTGKKDGDYQSCHGCDVYVSCVGGLRYDDRPCAPGGLVWDDRLKRCEYNSSTCHGCIFPPHCSGTGPRCIRSCYGLPNGNYQSCRGCQIFASCSNGRLYEGRRCAPWGTVWDDNKKYCSWYSNTCHHCPK